MLCFIRDFYTPKSRFLTKKRPKWRSGGDPIPMDFHVKPTHPYGKLQNRTLAASRRPFFVHPHFCVFFDDFSSKNMFLNEKTQKTVSKMLLNRVFFVPKTFFWQKKCQNVKKHQKRVRDPIFGGPDPPFWGGCPYGVQGDFDALFWPGENVSSRGARKTSHLTPPTPGGVWDPVFRGQKRVFDTIFSYHIPEDVKNAFLTSKNTCSGMVFGTKRSSDLTQSKSVIGSNQNFWNDVFLFQNQKVDTLI